MTQAGGCVCGNVRYEVEGEPAVKVYRAIPILLRVANIHSPGSLPLRRLPQDHRIDLQHQRYIPRDGFQSDSRHREDLHEGCQERKCNGESLLVSVAANWI
jgi:hypothetical protein